MSIQVATLVIEYNYSEPCEQTSQGSIWLFSGDGLASLADPRPIEEVPGWTKVIGPIDYEAAVKVHASLKRFFEQSGVTVIDQGIAD